MKFLRSIFTNSFIGLVCTMLSIFGVGIGLLTWREGKLLPEGLAYVVAGIAIFILGRKIAGRGDATQGAGAKGKTKR